MRRRSSTSHYGRSRNNNGRVIIVIIAVLILITVGGGILLKKAASDVDVSTDREVIDLGTPRSELLLAVRRTTRVANNNLNYAGDLYRARYYANGREFHIMMVGDDLMHTGVIETGKQPDGTYNYDCIYEDIKPYLDIADIKIINQETIFGGDDREFTSYPTFNSPTAMADAIVKAGFNVVCHASNHACDVGISGINHCKRYWDEKHPETLVVGIYGEEGINHDIPIIESDGVTFAIINYTYSANWDSVQSNLENHLNLLCPWDPGSRKIDMNNLNPQIIDDIKRADELADFVIVCPHWGVEYQIKENAVQDHMAQQMVEAGADIIIGTHPHVCQPVKWITASNGNQAICYYSLGNFVSTQYDPITLFEGLAWVTVRVDANGKYIVPEKTGVLPMVLQYKSGPIRITGIKALEDYTEDMAVAHGSQNRSGQIPHVDFYQQKCQEIFGDMAINKQFIFDSVN